MFSIFHLACAMAVRTITGPGTWYTRLSELGSICTQTLTHSQGPQPKSATHLEHQWLRPYQLPSQQAGYSPLDADGVGMLCAAARRAVRWVNGDREATFAMG